MIEIVNIIISYAAIWAPSLVAILGVITTVMLALNKTKAAINEFKKEDILKDLAAQVQKQAKENEELVRVNKLLLDKITHIKGYADSKSNEEGD